MNPHETECPFDPRVNAAIPCICTRLRAAYRRGYEAHANWRDHGVIPANQHGEGENP